MPDAGVANTKHIVALSPELQQKEPAGADTTAEKAHAKLDNPAATQDPDRAPIHTTGKTDEESDSFSDISYDIDKILQGDAALRVGGDDDMQDQLPWEAQ